MRLALSAASLVCTLCGCANNPVYFYETEKMAMTVEARPDPSQPVQGTLGLKQRVVLAAPKKTDTSHDSASVMSTFRFAKTPSENLRVGAFLIQSSLLTGDAAECVVPNSTDNKCAGAACAATPNPTGNSAAGNSNGKDGVPSVPTSEAAKVMSEKMQSSTAEAADQAISAARKKGTLVDVRNTVAKPYEKVDRTVVNSLLGVKPEAYTEQLHNVLRKKLEVEQ